MSDPMINPQLRALLGPTGPRPEVDAIGGGSKQDIPEGGKTFADTLKDSIAEVSRLQTEAETSVEGLVTGQSADVHGTMIALQKADLSFKMMMEVRNKILSAYQELNRMS